MSKIEWTSITVNPIKARWKDPAHRRKGGKSGHYCEKISTGCKFCYASGLQPFHFGLPHFQDANLEDLELYLDVVVLDKLRAMRKGRKIFWCSMTDLFGLWVKNVWIDQCFQAMLDTPQHTHQLLTKRSERMRDYSLQRRFKDVPNIWWGASCENQDYLNFRWPFLAQTNAALRWISYEPALGPLNMSICLGNPNLTAENRLRYRQERIRLKARLIKGLKDPQVNHLEIFESIKVDWVVAGGESGARSRPAEVDWIRSAFLQSQRHDVPFLFKQWGNWCRPDQLPVDTPRKVYDRRRTEKNRVFLGRHPYWKVGKRVAGRSLEGVWLDQYPEQKFA